MTAKVVSVQDAVARMPAGMKTLALGGMHLHNNPMATVLELVRQERPIARLVTSPSAAMAADVLVGAGLVGEIATSYVGFEHLGLAPCFRRAAEAGDVRVVNVCEASITHGLYAGAGGLPFAVLPTALELSDVWRSNPDSYRTVTDPFAGTTALVVDAIRPDVAIVHAAEADEHGTAWLGGAPFTDRLMALAARSVIVQVERIVPREVTAARPPGSTIPGFLVAAVVAAPGGCRPTASHGNYAYDEEAIKRYLHMARTADGFAEWVAREAAVPVASR